jgi:hypothetical protein
VISTVRSPINRIVDLHSTRNMAGGMVEED